MSELSMHHIVDVKLVNGKRIKIRKGKIVGYCNNRIHKGSLTSQLLNEHKCIERECRYFKKCSQSGFWTQQQVDIRMKEERKVNKKLLKSQKLEKEEKINRIKQYAEQIAKEKEYNIIITSVSERSEEKYTIFYVSDKNENDSKNYVSLIDEMFFQNSLLCSLVHVKDIDGKYVTINDFELKYKKNV